MAPRIAAVRGVLVVLASLGTLLQAGEPRAMLLGVISDPSGAVVAGAKVTAINAETAVRSSAESNQNGNYVVPYLAPGTYRLRVECPRFKPFEQGPIELRMDDRLRIDVTLRVEQGDTIVGVKLIY